MFAVTADRTILDAISEGVEDEGTNLVGGVMVEVAEEERNVRGWPAWMVAARCEGADGHAQVGVWATHDCRQIGPIIPVNATARELSSWGDAMSPESVEVNIQLLETYPEVVAAEEAARTHP